MSKYRAVYDKFGKAYEFENGELIWAREGLEASPSPVQSGPAVIGDIEPFVSVVDGSVISSRRDLRNHNARNNVVNTADLAGLPVKTLAQQSAPDQAYREATKRTIAEIINSRNYH